MRRRPPGPDKSGYLSEDTIAAIATAVGGPVALIRVSGPDAFSVMEKIASPSAANAAIRRATRSHLYDRDGKALDDALVLKFLSPDSFTGEDVVEFHVHGGAFNTRRILEQVFEAGARPALPGEFSFRAVRNGKMTLSQAQAVSDLISASNAAAVELALEKMSGSQTEFLRTIADTLRRLAVLAEAGIDFSDQDLDEVSLLRLQSQIPPVIETLGKLRSSYERGSRIQDGITLAFLGLPNAGKSSFFNSLLGEDRSIVSDLPGTTRDVVTEKLTLRERLAPLRCDSRTLRDSGPPNTPLKRSASSVPGKQHSWPMSSCSWWMLQPRLHPRRSNGNPYAHPWRADWRESVSGFLLRQIFSARRIESPCKKTLYLGPWATGP